MCTRPSFAFRVLHPRTLWIAHCSIFDVYADRTGWQNAINFIFIEINEQMTEFVCEHPRVYKLRLSHYNGAKITKNTLISDAAELDIDVSCQC